MPIACCLSLPLRRRVVFCRILTVFLATASVTLAVVPAKPQPESKETEGPVAVAFRTLQAKLPEAENLLAEGKWTEAKALMAAVFPEAARTVAQSQAMASILFHVDPEASYKLHKAVAAARPKEELPQYLWAVEQHRAGQWKGALESYLAAAKLVDDYAPTYGLAAECALQLGRVDEAVQLWQKSEKSESGTLEDFETDVCKVHGPEQGYRRREELMRKAKAGDAGAAVAMTALDLEWPQDWWNGGPNKRYLKVDLPVLEQLTAKGGREVTLALLAARLACEEPSSEDARAMIQKAGLLEKSPRLPDNGRVLSYLFTFIEEHKFASKDTLRDQWGPVLAAAAETSRDPELHNARGYLFLEKPELPAVDLKGWEMSRDARFAASYLGGLAAEKKLTLDTPELAKALAEFPGNSFIQALPLGLVKEGSARYRKTVIALIKADYAHLPRAGIIPRASAKPLRAAFAALADANGTK